MARKYTQKLLLLACLYSRSLEALLISTHGTFTENSSLTIACSIEAFEGPGTWSNDNINSIVTCFKGGSCLPSAIKPPVVFSANASGMYVVINPLTSAVKNVWYCGSNGLVVNVSFTILVPPTSEPTIFTTSPGSVIAGETIGVTCEVSGGKPLAIINWECAGSFNERNISTNSTAASSIQLTLNKIDDGKLCRCKASHLLWISNKTVDIVINVLYAPDTDPIIQQMPSGPIDTGNKVTLTCAVSGGKPLATLSWNCTGNTTNITSGNTASYSVELTVDRTYNNRVCTCIATHPVSSYRPTIQHGLIVYFVPDTNPSIEQTPPGPIVTGNNVTLTCIVSGGNPLAILFWDCTGSKTNNTSGNTASYSVVLTVDNFHNNRICTCSATHYFSSYRPTIQHGLIVYYAPDTTPSVEQIPSGPIVNGNKVKLICAVSGGNPLATLAWNCTGNNINNTSGNTASYTVELTVDKTYNNRICTCSATHFVSSYRPTIEHGLIVYYAPDAIPTIQQTPAGPIVTGSNVALICTVSGGNPLATLTWDCTGNTTNTTSGNTASSSIELTVDKTYSNRVCICSATHFVSSYKPTVQHTLIVYYAPNGPPSIQQIPSGAIISGNHAMLTCTVSGGNPLAMLSWDCNGTNINSTSGNTVSYSVELTVDKTYNNIICTCSATHYVSSYRPTIQHRLIVYFAPDVVINGNEIGEILEGMNITLTCNATGNPSTYTYHGWTQTFGNSTIRTLNKTRRDLTLTGVSYMDIGNYVCLVDNKISNNQNNTIQSATTSIAINFKPVFLEYNKTSNGKKDGNVTASIKFYSFPDIKGPVIWKNVSDNSIIVNGSNLFLSLKRTHIVARIYDAYVLVDTFSYESTLYLTNFQLHHQGFYTLEVGNSFGNNNLTIRIVISDIPQPPKNFSVKESSSKMVKLFWTAGFNGGNQQTFNITYGKINSIERESIYKAEISDSDQYEIIISDLIPATSYIFTITSANNEGTTSPENNTLIVVTDGVTETAETLIIGPVAGSLTGVFAATVIVIIIIIYIRKKKEKEHEDPARSLTHLGNLNGEDDLHDNILYESSGPINENKLGTCGVEYASVNKNKTKEQTFRETAIYPDVKKMPKLQLNDKTTRKEKNKVIKDEVYENMEHAFQESMEKRNKDGLQYADLIFNPTQIGAKFIIHGLEDKTIYAEVDTTKRADPLPQSDDEDEVGTLQSEFPNGS